MASTPSDATNYVDEQGRTDAEIYLTDIYDCKIIACKEMHQLADMMLPRFHEPYKDWHFDVEKAIRPVRFIERYCCYPEGEKRGKPFILEQFQRASFELAYGFVDDDLYRQFRQVFEIIARKNGKTSKMGAIVIYMATSDSPRELGAEVYCCANSESQARKCYGAADAIREKSPMLSKHLRRGMVQKRGRTGILHDKSGSFIYPLSSNVNKLDGLSASTTVFDEIMAAEDNGALLDVLEESTSARRQPFTWSISTENYVRHNVGDDRMAYAKGILDGSIHDDRFLPIIYKLDKRDEIYDEAMWVKANPGLGTIKSWEYLRDRVNKAKQSPSSMPSLLTKEFNLRSGAYSAYMDINECVNNTPIDFSISDVPYCVVGIDHAEKGDLAAAVARFMVPGDTNYYELARFWIPEKAIEINSAKDFKERDNVPYRQWAANGWVEIIPEVDRVNEIVFIEFLRELVDAGCYPFAVGYDQWRISEWADREMQRLIGSTRVVSVLQYPRVISPLMKEHRLDLKAKRVICPNPCLHHCRINVQARTDNNDNDFPQKKDLDHRRKIDGYMAELHSLYAFHKFEEEYLSAIEWVPPKGQQNPFAASGYTVNE